MLTFFRSLWFSLLWVKSGFMGGRPFFIKKMVIEKFSIKDAVWIETGTFKGDTTAFLAGLTHSVITIEPDDFLFKKASLRFSKIEKVTVVHGKSETELIKITENLAENCNFWLDGHY